MGVSQTVEGFERASLIEAMTELSLTGDFALATPEMAQSARFWARVALGLTLLDVAGFVRSASQLAKLRAVMASPDLQLVLSYSRRNLGEAAEALGMSESQLARTLSLARGSARQELLERITKALEPRMAGGRYGPMGWPEGYTTEILNRMRTTLMADPADIGRVTEAMRRFGIPVDEDMVAAIKTYNFDSPGLRFYSENYYSWGRLAAGTGTIHDARYLVHEAAEIRALRASGFDYNPARWAEMGKFARATWHRQFEAAYERAHALALGEEFDFVARQVERLAGGNMRISGPEVIAIEASDPLRRRLTSAGDALDRVRIQGQLIPDLPNYGQWLGRAKELVPLDEATRAQLGDAIYFGAHEVSGQTRANLVRAGADPTLLELIAIVKRASMR
jgi:hypothetical protein